MTPRDRLQRLLFEHRTAHDPASSEREILRMFEAVRSEAYEDAARVCDRVIERPAGYGGSFEGYGPMKTRMTAEEIQEAIRAQATKVQP